MALTRDERGQAMAELSMVIPFILLMVLGVVDLGRMVWQENTLAYAAREGTRYAIVHGSASSAPVSPDSHQPVIDIVRRAAIGVPGVAVDVAWPDQSGGSACYDRTCRVQVDATAPFVPLPSQYLMGGAFWITLRGGSVLVIQR